MKYALALGGGGTRGAFEVGVWQALKDLGIRVSAIAGTSIGAVNGAIFASGCDGEELWKSIKAQDVVDIKSDNMFSLDSLISVAKKVSEGGVDTSAFLKLLEKVIDEDAVRNSGILYGLCTFRTDTKESLELFINQIPKGELVQYIMASASFPLFKPTKINGTEYSDGAWRNNLPINMLIDRGYDTIISVSVKGPGVIRPIDQSGVNVINIHCRTPEVGVMDFDPKSISESIKNGYYECMRVFGRYEGDKYSVTPETYNHARMVFGPQIVTGILEAAEICKLDPYRVYDFDELCHAVFEGAKNNTKLKLMIVAMESEIPGKSILDSLGKTFRAANSIVYLKKHLEGNF